MSFKDHFSTQSRDYSRFRPAYPKALYQYLASIAPATQRAWDCATGSGQAAIGLAPHFHKVIATDASEAQIANAVAANGVEYRVAPAEHSGLDAASMDLVTVAQAVHWFDLDAFGKELERVLKPQGIVAVWTYHLLKITPEIDRVVYRLYDELLGEYWPPERMIVERRYADIELPLQALTAPEFAMPVALDLPALMGYLNTWSATQRYIQDKGHNPVEQVADELRQAWGRQERHESSWPLTLKLWQKPG